MRRDGRRGARILLALTVLAAVPVAALTLTALLVVGAAPASAHATVGSTEPADGAHLDEGPQRLVLHLDEPVTLLDGSAQLIDDSGERHPLADVGYQDGRRTLVLTPAGPVPDGAYLATARVTSADTHVVSLSLQFTVGEVTRAGAPAAPAAGDDVGRYVGPVSKAAVYLGLVLSVGTFLAGRWAWPGSLGAPRHRWVLRLGAGALVLGLAGRVLVLAAQRAGGFGALAWGHVSAVLGTAFGTATAVAVVLSVPAAVLVPDRRASRSTVGVVQAAAVVTAVTLGGHGGSTDRWPWSFVETFVHVYAVTVWLGGVAFLVLVLRSVADVRRWHRVALAHVALVLLGGALLALAQVSPPAALLTTTYGRVLLLKAALVAGVGVLGLLSYRWYRQRAAAPGRPTSVLVEASLAVAVLAVTSVLSSVAPAKDVYTTDVAATLDFGDDQVVHVRVDTVRRGAQTITVRYAPGAAAAPGVQIDLASAQAGVARLPVQVSAPARTGDELTWSSTGLTVPAPGRWQVTVRFDGSQGPRLASFFYEVL